MKKKTLLFLALLLVLLSAGLLLFLNRWNQPPPSIEQATGIKVVAAELFSLYNDSENEATKQFNGKVLEITGIVQSIDRNQEGRMVVHLKTNDPLFGVNCTLEQDATIRETETITVKGICSGFTTDVIMIRCYVLNKSI
jgi:hypothetical protein